MSQVVLGIDVSKNTLDVVLLQGEKERRCQVANSPDGFSQLMAWLKKARVAQLHACLEATGRYGEAVADFLYEHDFQVSVVNPARIKFYGDSKLRRVKTDRTDASLIAEFCQRERPPLWTPPKESVHELQQRVRRLGDLKSMRQQEKNRLQAGVKSLCVLSSLREQIARLDEAIKALSREIKSYVNQHPELKRQKELLESIPGIGELTAMILLGEVPDFRSFDSARQLAAYAGLVPEQRTSGTSIHKKPRMSKRGNAHLRKALYMPALTAKLHNPLMIALSQRMAQTGHAKMEIVGAIMRKLLHLAYGVIKTGMPFDPHYADALAA